MGMGRVEYCTVGRGWRVLGFGHAILGGVLSIGWVRKVSGGERGRGGAEEAAWLRVILFWEGFYPLSGCAG